MIANKLESRVLDTLLSIYKMTSINFNGLTYKDYIKERRITQNGFIGYQVPRKGIDRTYRNDFSIFVPNKMDIRIECKSLSMVGSLSRSVITEESIIASTMPEKKLILLAVGEGFNGKEFIHTINRLKDDRTKIVNNMNGFVMLINKMFD